MVCENILFVGRGEKGYISCIKPIYIKQDQPYDEALLFRMLLDGKEEAFEAIYNVYAVPLLNAAFRRLRSEEEAKEVVQEVFISLFLKKNEIKYAGNLGGYLHTVLRHRILDIFRVDLLYASHHQQLRQQQEGACYLEDRLERKELALRLQQCINRLPDKCREVFILSRYDGLSYKAIATRLKISVNTVEKHVGKALRLLRLQLGDEEILLLVLATWGLTNY
ncbi:RNA polymerase sigma factor [Chitinophaga polysaccharea]|uniref:RNA polymerase sigma factor n=2 Tax=Chitinophaga TaxID=79328 RepID=UPI001B3B1D9F|nr:RNA polymerase sigma-70 factor [Chitinophaga polysaccharea]